ncbi:hypothetical protein ACFQ61_08530 [Streptomyces sp. NPDC056500]|uniref:hypothetical protein n=1 Tax=Streptomyces sp. NPDC056500 TaxID=3345840 RepID=UPI003699BFEF
MTMSRKHYRAIAAVLNRAHQEYPEAASAITHITLGVAEICGKDNRRFCRQQFIDAARPESP